MDWFEIASFLALFLLMMSIGTELTAEDFRRVARFPALVAIASTAQFALLPLLAGFLGWALELRGEVLLGMAILGACPGGGFSNLYAYAGGGHLALSVTLTAVSCTTAVLVMPYLLWITLQLFAEGSEVVPVPVGQMFAELLARVLTPIALGMWLRRRWPEAVARHGKTLSRSTLLLMAAIIPAVLVDQGTRVLADAVDGLLPALLFTAAAMGLGWGIGRASGRERSDPCTVMIEFGVRNVAVAVIICWSVLRRPELLAYCFAYMIVQVPLALAAVAVHRARLTRWQGAS